MTSVTPHTKQVAAHFAKETAITNVRAHTDTVERLLATLTLTPRGPGEYESAQTGSMRTRAFGGQTFAQAIAAAAKTVAPDRQVHSAQGQFLWPGDPSAPARFKVNHDRDGRSYSARRVEAFQRGRLILTLSASFQLPESGFSHQVAMPSVPPPETLVSEASLREAQREVLTRNPDSSLLAGMPIELRPVLARNYTALEPEAAIQHFWFKPYAPLTLTDPNSARTVLAYASDMMLLSTALLPHGVHWATSDIANGTINHSLWIHEQPMFDDWLLYSLESHWSGGARALCKGLIFDRNGKLIATAMQEGFLRPSQSPTKVKGSK